MSGRSYYRHPVAGWGWHDKPTRGMWARTSPVCVSEARASQGLPAFGDARDNMTITELDALAAEVAELRAEVDCLKEGRDMLARKYDRILCVIQHDTERLLSIRRERDAAIRERDEARREVNNIHTRIAQLIGGVK